MVLNTRWKNLLAAAALAALLGSAPPLGAASLDQVWFTVGQGGTPTGIYRVGMDSSSPVTQQWANSPTAVVNPWGIAVDPVEGKYFYAENDDFTTFEVIRSGSMAVTNSGSLATIYSTANPGFQLLAGLRVDTAAHNLYFTLYDYSTASNNGVYRVAETGGPVSKVGGTGGVALQGPFNLALDMADNLVFLTDSNANSLDYCNLTTGNAVSLYGLPGASTSYLYGVDVDPVNRYLYVTETPQGPGAGNEVLKFSFTATGSGSTAAVGSLTGPATLYDSTGAGMPYDVMVNPAIGFLYLADDSLPGAARGSVSGGVSIFPVHTVTGGGSAQNVCLEAAPVMAPSGGTVTYTEGGAGVPVDASVTLSDPTSAELPLASVYIVSGFLSGDILSATTTGTSITASYNASTGVLNLTGPDTTAHFSQVLRTVNYYSTSPNARSNGSKPTRTLLYSATDGFITVGGSANDSVTIPDAAPAVTAGATAHYNAGGVPVPADPGLAAADQDNTTLASAAISISGGFLPGDTLGFTNQNGITGSYNSSTGVLSLSGTSSVANYQAALQGVAYSSSAPDPGNGGTDNTRTLSWTLNDGSLDSNTATSTVDITVFTPTPTKTATSTSTATATPTDSPSSTPSGTPTLTPTASYSPTASPTLTATATITETPTVTDTPTISPTPTATPVYNASGTGALFLGPNFLTNGQSAGLFFPAPPQSTNWKVYAVNGELVDHFTVSGAAGQSWNPGRLASGLYLVRVHVTYQDGSTQDKTFKAVVIH